MSWWLSLWLPQEHFRLQRSKCRTYKSQKSHSAPYLSLFWGNQVILYFPLFSKRTEILHWNALFVLATMWLAPSFSKELCFVLVYCGGSSEQSINLDGSLIVKSETESSKSEEEELLSSFLQVGKGVARWSVVYAQTENSNWTGATQTILFGKKALVFSHPSTNPVTPLPFATWNKENHWIVSNGLN